MYISRVCGVRFCAEASLRPRRTHGRGRALVERGRCQLRYSPRKFLFVCASICEFAMVMRSGRSGQPAPSRALTIFFRLPATAAPVVLPVVMRSRRKSRNSSRGRNFHRGRCHLSRSVVLVSFGVRARLFVFHRADKFIPIRSTKRSAVGSLSLSLSRIQS